MFATVRRYEGVDQQQQNALTKKVDSELIPQLNKLKGFGGYYLIEAGHGVMTSVSLFDTSEHAHESNRVAADWVKQAKLEQVLPHAPTITAGQVTAHS
jgi:hypothetical protein